MKTGASDSVEYRIEAITLPVSDVDRAKEFYLKAGWNLDVDTQPTPEFRVVQFTPPGSPCSISFGVGFPQSEPGSYVNTYLVVSDIEAAHADLVARGIEVSDIYHFGPQGQTPGPDPQRGDYGSYADFSDPDGNIWLLQEVPSRASGA
ncbi:MAG TPA: VOC family protein [Candidatus Limnocylindria bacterium]|jgi:predicted enzyme related to lactoylglutathione lyase